jgi:hypothetical protein
VTSVCWVWVSLGDGEDVLELYSSEGCTIFGNTLKNELIVCFMNFIICKFISLYKRYSCKASISLTYLNINPF